MAYTAAELRETILELHPEIEKNGLQLSVDREAAGDRYLLQFAKAGEELGAYLDQEDADECMAGEKSLNLAVQLTQIIAEFADILAARRPG